LTVSIYVEHFNPAKRLYHRLGFIEIGENGVYHLMRWEAPAK
jgi:predicted GNAT family acetyltransferase